MKKRTKFLIVMAISFLLILMSIKPVSKYMAKTVGINYVNDNYFDRSLVYSHVEYSTSHGTHFAVFNDKNSEKYSFMLNRKYFPTDIWYDPIKQKP